MAMARIVWAIFQTNSKRRLNEEDYRFNFEPQKRPTPEQYREKAMRAYLGHGGVIGDG